MDQSASVFSQRGSAVYVSFKPQLNATPVAFPQTDPELTWMVAQSFVAADKHVTAPVCYNLRVVECSLAAVFLAKVFGLKRDLPSDSAPLGVSLRGFHDAYFEEKEGITDNTKTGPAAFGQQLETLLQLVDDYLPQEDGYTREEISAATGIPASELDARFTAKFPVRADRFLLRQRTLHVFGEARRVLRFRELLSTTPPPESLLGDLGDLMNQTQDSCRDLYDCSCPELDEMCKLAREAGAYGSRLTGAGWGGCSVHLVPNDKVDAVKQAWEKYYRKHFPDMTAETLREAVVVSKPGSGAFLFKVTGEKVV